MDVKVTKETVIGDLLDIDPGVAQFFLAIGMHCLGCPVSRGETIEEACAVHGTDADELIKNINEYLNGK
jgi:hybrid cluster-associated redox disulfide protein